MSVPAQFTTTALLIALAPTVAATDFDPAGYHAEQCMRCHDTGVYTRDDRFVQSYSALKAQVERCDINLARGIPPEQLSQLIDYLNGNYYKFDK